METRSGRGADWTQPVCSVRTKVLCLGNDLLGDDAFGLIAGRLLKASHPELDVIESSASGLHLIDLISGCEQLVVIDTSETGRNEPGTVYVLDESSIAHIPAETPHCTGLFDTLRLARTLGFDAPATLTVIAVEAADCRTIGGQMDPRVESALDRVVSLAAL